MGPRPVIPFVASLDHLLQSASWAREKLQPHAGKAFAVDCPPVRTAFLIRDDGGVAPPPPDAAPAVTVRLSPGVVMRLAARDATAWNAVAADGDPALAETLGYVFRNLRWDLEEDLSRVVGDVAAHRIANAGRAIEHWLRDSADQLGRNVAEYWTYEQPLLVSAYDVEQFNRAVDTLRDDVARLARRIEQRATR